MKKSLSLLLALLMIFALFVSCDKSEGRPRETNAPTTAETSANTETSPESELDVTDIETDPESETTPDTETEKTETESDKGGENTTEKIETDPETDPETDSETDPETDPETDGDGTDGPDAPEINYGTLSAPVTTTYAYHMCYGLENNAYSASPFYVEGKVTEIGETGKYYKNVYFTDGTTNMLIYTINMGEGISGFEVGDTIIAYGYVKNYNGTIELATYEGSVYVYAVAVESAGDSTGGNTDDSDHAYTDFTDEEKALFTDNVGFVIPFIPNDEYFVEEYSYEDYGEQGVNFYTFGNTREEFDAYRELFSDYSCDGTEDDEYGDTWYYYSKGDAYVDMTHYYYEGEYVVDIYVYTVEGEGDSGDTEAPDYIDYGTLSAPVTTTYAHNVCAYLAIGGYSAYPFYIEGEVTEIGETGKYYKNVYFTDGTTNMLIYTINMGEGVSGFEVGDTIIAYGYVKNYNGTIELATYEGSVYVYAVAVESAGDSAGGDTDDSDHAYTDFTDEEKALFTDRVGFVIPFIPNDEYYVEEYSDDEYGEYGVNFYAFGNSQAEFDAYRELFSDYSYDGTENDEYGDAWYYYSKGDVCVDMTYYYYEGEYVTDIYVYVLTEDGGSSGEGSDTDVEVDKNLITNNGAGLPEDSDGVYDVDFTKGNYVQNVTEQGYYMDGCPTTGTPAVLVIPIEFSDMTAASKGYTVENLEKIFNGVNGDTIYYSVKEYYFASSYNKLDLNVTVLDSWFCPKETSSYYADATYDYYGTEMSIGDQLILDEALAYLSTVMDLSEFDSDKNGMIDAVVMVNTLDIDAEVEFRWAYRYWNVYTDDEGYYFEYDAVSANDYVWMSYQFMFEAYDEETGEVNYDSTNPLNPYTFIHEVGHVLGAEDYYDTAYESSPMNGLDVMDSMMGDHNPYSKFNYGWITDSRLVVTDSTVTLTLEAFEKSGDTLILASNWDESLGAYQEYYVIMYYTATGLNSGEGGYFLRDGVVVYHINSTLYAEDYGDETYYDVYNNNTDMSDESGTKDNLVEYVQSSAGNYTYAEGDTLPEVVDDMGNALGYTFTVDSVTADCVTITFEKIG